MQNQTTLKMFGTGQVTIPKKWRTMLEAKEFIAIFNDGREIILRPIEIGWESLFDARKDGGMMDVQKLSRALKKDLKKKDGSNRKIS